MPLPFLKITINQTHFTFQADFLIFKQFLRNHKNELKTLKNSVEKKSSWLSENAKKSKLID
jgi:hypothetical protein